MVPLDLILMKIFVIRLCPIQAAHFFHTKRVSEKFQCFQENL